MYETQYKTEKDDVHTQNPLYLCREGRYQSFLSLTMEVFMIREHFRYLPPEELTPQERRMRIVELLAQACLRHMAEKKAGVFASAPSAAEAIPRFKGPAPFGERDTVNGRVTNDAEAACINRIRELSAGGQSSQRIAERLNQEGRRPRFASQWSRTAVWRVVQRLQKPKSSVSPKHSHRKPSKLDGLKCFFYMVDPLNPD